MSIDATCSRPSCERRGTYWMLAICGNCSREYDVELSKTHVARDEHPMCPFCGVSTLWTWKPFAPMSDPLLTTRLGLKGGEAEANSS